MMSIFNKIIIIGAGDMAQWLRLVTALAEGPAPTWKPTAICNSSFKEFDPPF